MTTTTTDTSSNVGGGNAAAVAQTWFTGLEPEVIGHVQNKGWDKLDPAAAAIEAAKAHRAAEGKLGVPADRLLRRPTEGNVDETKAFWQSVGAPADPKEYAFTGIDFGDADLNTGFTEAMRSAAAAKFVPKDIAEHLAAAAFKFMEDHGAKEEAASSAKMLEERQKLEADWGPPEGDKFKAQMGIADRTALALGVTTEQLQALRDGLGGAAVARLFNSLGFKLGEARYTADPNNPTTGMMTREQALERRWQLAGIDANGHGHPGKGDTAFMEKVRSGDVAAKKEWNDLLRIIAGA